MAGYVDMKLDYSFKKAFSDKEQLCAFLNESGMVAAQSETKKSIDRCVLYGRARGAFHC